MAKIKTKNRKIKVGRSVSWICECGTNMEYFERRSYKTLPMVAKCPKCGKWFDYYEDIIK